MKPTTEKTEIAALPETLALPWRIRNGTSHFHIVDSEGYYVTKLTDTADQKANAEYIVRAANAFPKLVEALEAAVAAGEYVVGLVHATDRAGQSANPHERADWVGTCAHAYGAMSFLNESRAALALARDGRDL